MIKYRRRYNIGVTKIPHHERELAHDVQADDDRGFMDLIGADTRDDDDEFPVGSKCNYSLELTPDEAARLIEHGEQGPDIAGNSVRFVEAQVMTDPVSAPVVTPVDAEPAADTSVTAISPNGVPADRTLNWLRCNFARITEFHGRNVPMCVMDQGTTAAQRSRMAHTLVRRTIVGDTPPGGQEIFPGAHHGCLVAGSLVPYGGLLMDAMVINADGRSSDTHFAAGLRWACQSGAKVINYSFTGYQASQTYVDAINFMNDYDAVIYIAAGNDSLNRIGFPADYSRSFPNRVASCIAFDEATDSKASFSNYSAAASGCAPGVQVLSSDEFGNVVAWSGTSCASPMMGQMAGRLQTDFRVTARQALQYMNSYTRNTGQGADFQGGGAYALQSAVEKSGAFASANNNSLMMVL